MEAIEIQTLKEKLGDALTENLFQHHKIYRLPSYGEYLEEMISKSFTDIGENHIWEPDRSHKVSTDITLESGSTASVKSGQYNLQKNNLTFSGSRLGQYSSIEDKLRAIISQSADFYICVAKIDSDWKPVPKKIDKKKYYLFMFSSEILDYDNHKWVPKKTKNGNENYEMDVNGFSASIRASMSHQLWTTISLSKIGDPITIIV